MQGKVVSQCVSKKGYIINGVVYKNTNGTSIATAINDANDFYARFGHIDLTGKTVSGPLYFNNGNAMIAIASLVKE